MYGGNNTNKCKMWHKFNTCMEGVYEVYTDQKIRDIYFSMIGEKGKECQLSVRLAWKQVGLSVYRS